MMKQTLRNTACLTIRKDVTRKDGTNSIILRLKIAGKKKDLSLGEFCPLQLWDAEGEKVKRAYNDADRINDVIGSKIARAKQIIFDYKIHHKQLNIDDFCLEFGISNSKSLIDFIRSEIDIEKQLKSKAQGTISNYEKDLSKLKRYKKEIYFSEFTETFLQNYEIYMRNDLGNNKNTINRSMRFLRNFNNRGSCKGLTELNPFGKYKLSTEKTKLKFLEITELGILQKYFDELPEKHKHKKTLRPYLFCCYSGLRHSDISLLRFKDIQGENIYFRMKKTSEPLRIPLILSAKKLIGEITGPDLPVFKVPCNQTTNRCLKEIAKAKEINKTLTFHTARHTFATICLNLGMEITVVRDLLGHSDLKQTQLYAKVREGTKGTEMKKWDNVFK